MAYEVRRDFRGYGATPPAPKWPGAARLAVNFVLNHEEGSELSYPEGDGASEWGVSDSAGQAAGAGRDLAAESMFEYGSRVGFWRLTRLFQERVLPLTVFGWALTLEGNPEAAASIRNAGYDVCCHRWRWVKHFQLSEAEEREHIGRAVASLEKTVGHRPEGWYCRYGPSVNTRRLLAEAGGFLYDSDSYADELPWWVTVEGREHLVVPYSLTHNDGKFIGRFGTADDWFAFIRDGFDMLYAEGADTPKMMSVGLQMRMIGHPARAIGLARLLDHIARHDRVWVTRRIDIARHWASTHPYAGTGLNE